MDLFLDTNQKQKLFNSLLAVAILLASFLGIKVLSGIKEFSYIGKGVYPSNVISVSGKGEALATPDTASFSFSVVEEGKTVKDAQDVASKKMNSILSAIKAFKIDDKDVKTTNYTSYPKYDYVQPVCTTGYCTGGKQVLKGYEVTQTVLVKVRKTDDSGSVLAKVGELGATNISGLDLVIDDMDKIEAQARDEAIKDAKERAEVLSKSLGIKLKKIVNFYESGNQPVYFAADSKMGMGEMAPSSVAPQIPTGENKIVSNVTITYEVD